MSREAAPAAYELVRCQGAVVNMVGTAGADVLRSDAILGLGGADEISGRDGNDRLTGGSGKGRLFGQGDQDRLNTRDGVKGKVVADGGSGQDTCGTDLEDRRISCQEPEYRLVRVRVAGTRRTCTRGERAC